MNDITREGGVEAPTRHPINWKTGEFNDEGSLFDELERVYDICHGCRRCVNLCNAFPTLFDLIDESETFEVDGVKKDNYWDVVEHCYLCDLCYMTKCPYVPPHEWNVDFPHLMLRAKAQNFRNGNVGVRDKILTSTDKVGSFVGIPVVAQTANIANTIKPMRKIMEKTIGIHSEAVLPKFYSNSLRKRFKNKKIVNEVINDNHKAKVAVFVTCYGNRNEPDVVEDLIAILKHNQLEVRLVKQEKRDDILLPGYIYDLNILTELRNNCLAYIHGNQVGGTNPALLEAMGSYSFIIARDVNFNHEVLESGGIYYEKNIKSLLHCLNLTFHRKVNREKAIKFSINKIKKYYNWDRIALNYNEMLENI